jgi:hypothetical protein
MAAGLVSGTSSPAVAAAASCTVGTTDISGRTGRPLGTCRASSTGAPDGRLSSRSPDDQQCGCRDTLSGRRLEPVWGHTASRGRLTRARWSRTCPRSGGGVDHPGCSGPGAGFCSIARRILVYQLHSGAPSSVNRSSRVVSSLAVAGCRERASATRFRTPFR